MVNSRREINRLAKDLPGNRAPGTGAGRSSLSGG